MDDPDATTLSASDENSTEEFTNEMQREIQEYNDATLALKLQLEEIRQIVVLQGTVIQWFVVLQGTVILQWFVVLQGTVILQSFVVLQCLPIIIKKVIVNNCAVNTKNQFLENSSWLICWVSEKSTHSKTVVYMWSLLWFNCFNMELSSQSAFNMILSMWNFLCLYSI